MGSAHGEEPTRLSAAEEDKKIKATADENKKSAQTSIEDSLVSSSRARDRKRRIPQRRVTVTGTGGMQPKAVAADQPELPAHGQERDPFADFSVEDFDAVMGEAMVQNGPPAQGRHTDADEDKDADQFGHEDDFHQDLYSEKRNLKHEQRRSASAKESSEPFRRATSAAAVHQLEALRKELSSVKFVINDEPARREDILQMLRLVCSGAGQRGRSVVLDGDGGWDVHATSCGNRRGRGARYGHQEGSGCRQIHLGLHDTRVLRA